MTLGPLYHWSPRDRRKGINRSGLVPGKRNVADPTLHGVDAEGNTIVDDLVLDSEGS